jgi:hypothetical protein
MRRINDGRWEFRFGGNMNENQCLENEKWRTKAFELKSYKVSQLIKEFILFVEPEVSSPFYHQLRLQSARSCPCCHKNMRFWDLNLFLWLVLCLILRRELSAVPSSSWEKERCRLKLPLCHYWIYTKLHCIIPQKTKTLRNISLSSRLLLFPK